MVHTTSGQYSAAGWPYEKKKKLFISRTLPKPFAVIAKNTIVKTSWHIKARLVEHWQSIIRGDIMKSVRAEKEKDLWKTGCVNNKNMRSSVWKIS